jgi:Dolichyl-phosphate-mannose-protein mannosyltransferase
MSVVAPPVAASVSPPRSGRAARRAALLIAALAAAIAVNRGTFSPSISDASGYLAGAQLLREGQLARPVPLSLIPAVRDSGATLWPLGFRPGVDPGIEVPTYPLGYPMLMAAAMLIGGELAACLVSPAMLAVLIWCVFLVAEGLGGSVAGVLAAVLIAINPMALQSSITLMSDVPAAACWAAAWYFALRGTSGAAVTAGALVALASMIRPNLAPLALVPGVLVLSGGVGRRAGWSWKPAVWFGVVAAVGPLVTVWSQAALYGSALRPGYPGWETFFRLANIGQNLRTYPGLYLNVFGWLPLAGLALTLRPPAGGSRVVASAVAFIVINVALYAAYLPYDHWQFLRFFLPAMVALTVLFATAVALAMDTLRRRRLVALAWLLPLAVVAISWQGREVTAWVLDEWRVHQRVPLMGHYLRDALPRHAVVITYYHSGAVAYYTGHSTLSLESLPPQTLDEFVATLERLGAAPVFLVDEVLEEGAFKALFRGSAYGALDWPARAEFFGETRIRYFVASDRERYRTGTRWATDVLRP